MSGELKYLWDQSQLASLDEMVKLAFFPPCGDDAFDDGFEPTPNGFEAISQDDALRAKLSKYLEKMQFRQFSYLGHGNFATVFRTETPQLLLRISVDQYAMEDGTITNGEPQRPLHPAILQPIKKTCIEGDSCILRVEIMPQIKDFDQEKCRFQGVNKQHIEMLKEALSASGLLPFDVEEKNAALLEDGTPVVIDGGAVKIMDDKPQALTGDHLSPWFLKHPHTGEATWKQHTLIPQILSGDTRPSLNANQDDATPLPR